MWFCEGLVMFTLAISQSMRQWSSPEMRHLCTTWRCSTARPHTPRWCQNTTDLAFQSSDPKSPRCAREFWLHGPWEPCPSATLRYRITHFTTSMLLHSSLLSQQPSQKDLHCFRKLVFQLEVQILTPMSCWKYTTTTRRGEQVSEKHIYFVGCSKLEQLPLSNKL
jgi:hypothetical protein